MGHCIFKWAKGKSHPILAGIPKKRDSWKYQGNNKKIILKFILRTFFECRQLGSISSITVRRLRYFEYKNVILDSI
jgi:hypothetical protein